jgi:hypothetical protein
MSLLTFGHWLYATPASTVLRQTLWVIPTVQAVHIVSVAILYGSALVSNLRLAGVLATDETSAAVVRRYLPWMWYALAVLLLSGLLLILAEPDRTLGNAVFWIKMTLLLTAFGMTLFFQKPLLDPGSSVPNPDKLGTTKPTAWLSLAIWTAVICCGRFIAYT